MLGLRTFTLTTALILASTFCSAQTASSAPKAPAVRAGDVDSIEHILAAVYDVISGPAGPRDWERFHSLFFPDARFIPTGPGKDAAIHAKMFSADEYIKLSEPYFLKEGFFETSIANRIENWGSIAQVWSTYESRHAKNEKPFE